MGRPAHARGKNMGETPMLRNAERMPLLSVIIPMRNAEPFVRAAVESVVAQEGVDLEVIIVDDGSLDRSVHIVKEIADPRIRMIPGPRQGISAAFNAGLAAAKGE